MSFIPVCEPALLGNEATYVMDAVQTGWISSAGKYVNLFEEQFADYCGVKYAVAVSNGTVALHLALKALNIGQGDEVIIPNFTMIASAFSVCYTGATPVFIDANPQTWNIDVSKIEEKITKKTKAIMPVHIFGNPCDMDIIQAIASKYKLAIVEDAAEAHGAEYRGVKAGNLSDISAFSFFANKNLTTGEGGMVLTNNKELYDRARYFKNLCFPLDAPRVYEHKDIGFNYRMSNLHAAIGFAQVQKADEYRTMRIKNHKLYKSYLSNIEGIKFQQDEKNVLNVNWMNVIVVDPKIVGISRDQIVDILKDEQIETRLLFTGMSKQKSLQSFGCDCTGEYPITDQLTANGFYLPSASTLSKDQIDRICNVILKAIRKY
jgi:perosamine synthetase